MFPQICASTLIRRNMSVIKQYSRQLSKHAVIFDMGGVIIPTFVPIINDFSIYNKLTKADTHRLLFDGNDQSLFGQLECGAIDLNEFSLAIKNRSKVLFGREVEDTISNEMVKSFLTFKPYPQMISAIKTVKEHGLKTALLSNTFYLDKTKDNSSFPIDKNLFDLVGLLIIHLLYCLLLFSLLF